MPRLTVPSDKPLRIVGDVHGDATAFAYAAATDRFVVQLGDLTDYGPDSAATLRIMFKLIDQGRGLFVMGNHDLALVRAAGLDDLPPSPYWVERYGSSYDHRYTFESYLGRSPDANHGPEWVEELAALKAAMPADHRALFAGLPWCAEAEGHLFLHCGLSPEFDCPATVQLECLRRKLWERGIVHPKFGTKSDRMFAPEYPVWLGADRKASKFPLAYPGKVQVTGHEFTRRPDANAVRIRIDTSGGTTEPLTACLLRGPTAEPVFVFSNDE